VPCIRRLARVRLRYGVWRDPVRVPLATPRKIGRVESARTPLSETGSKAIDVWRVAQRLNYKVISLPLRKTVCGRPERMYCCVVRKTVLAGSDSDRFFLSFL